MSILKIRNDVESPWIPIPSYGGSSGGNDDNWELIVDTTIEQEVISVNFTETLQGESIADAGFKKLWIYMKVTPLATNPVDVIIKGRFDSTKAIPSLWSTKFQIGYGAKTSGGYMKFLTKVVPSPFGLIITDPAETYNDSSMKDFLTYVGRALKLGYYIIEPTQESEQHKIDKIEIGSYTPVFGIGSIIRIWACR